MANTLKQDAHIRLVNWTNDVQELRLTLANMLGTYYHVFVSYTGNSIEINYWKPDALPGEVAAKSMLNIPMQDLVNLMMSAQDDEAAKQAIMDYFWGWSAPTDKSSLPSGASNKDYSACSHEWQEVILFHTPQLRCRFCDIKKPVTDDK